jgi:cytochrome c oxidase assembly factor CtaG
VSSASVAAGPWDWVPHPLLWAVLATVGGGTALLHRRLLASAAHPVPWPRVRIVRFVGALVVSLVAMGWPLGDLAAHWSLSALVLQRCILVLAVASLLLSGLPDDVLAWATRPAPVDALLLRVLWPPAAVVTVTVVLVGSMIPPLVAAQSNSAAARGMLAVVVVAAGIVLWLPILGRVPGIPRPRPMIRAVYLVAQAIVPVFLSFVFILATRPLYATLDHTRPVIGLSPLADQQIAGFVSKLSFLLTLLTVAGVILAQAPDTDDDLGPEDPLVWADIERHFERADRRHHAAAAVAPPSPPQSGPPGTASPGDGGGSGGAEGPPDGDGTSG